MRGCSAEGVPARRGITQRHVRRGYAANARHAMHGRRHEIGRRTRVTGRFRNTGYAQHRLVARRCRTGSQRTGSRVDGRRRRGNAVMRLRNGP